ncbi:MAG: hypothetical protein ACLQBL_34655 [Polyangiaceae bacterium]
MTKRSLFSSPLLWIGPMATALPLALAIGCSSSPPEEGCFSGQTVACTCANGQSGTSACGSQACSCDLGEDSGTTSNIDGGTDSASIDTPGDATHLDEKPPPTTGYAECAVKGSFGWPCSLTTSGPDPTECTDPNFPDCFVGGQGAWCTASCATFGVCPPDDQDGGDAGCTPTACNARSYCK